MDASTHTSPLLLSFSTFLFIIQASALTSPNSGSLGSLGISCNYTLYPESGCEDSTLFCDSKTDECLCRPNYVPVQGTSSGSSRCILPLKNLLEPCTSSRECEKISGKCMHSNYGEITSDSIVNPSTVSPNSGLTTSNLLNGVCQCSDGTFFSFDKKKCLRRIIGSPCANITDCYSRPNVVCNSLQNKCLCLDGYIADENTDQCRTLANSIIGGPSSVGQRSPLEPPVQMGPKATPLCDYGFMYDHAFKRCIPLMHWDHQRTWSALVWKIMVLCIVLLLLMVLASGLQRARQNANMINWSRALELYARENNNGTRSAQAILTSIHGAASRPDGIMVMMPPPPPQYSQADTRRSVHLTNTCPRDDPPSYEEAIRIAPAPTVVTTGVSENSTDQGSK